MADTSHGTVYLVGAGPGDRGLLTVRGMELLAQADVVVYDYLSDSSLLEMCKDGARLVDVGKRPGRPVPQNEINEVLIKSAATAKAVVRLKGGDPFVFGRGGEEAMALTERGIPFEVVPGVSSAIAVPAYAGIPVTHRGLSTSFTVVTGHRHGNAVDQVDWAALARLGGTIVVLMGVAHRKEIAEKLISGGLGPDTPVAAVRWGTRSDQNTVRTTLARLGKTEIQSPSTIVIGAVAALALNWFERRPLLGKTIVVTRAKSQSDALTKAIRELGGQPFEVPTIEILPPDDNFAGLESAAKNLGSYQWVVFTSSNAVPQFFRFLRDARDLAGVKVAAIGNGTASELAKYNVVPDLVPSRFVAESLVEVFPEGTGRVLLPRAKVARDALPVGLIGKGWQVDVVEAYKTEAPDFDPQAAAEIASSDAIVFTASSTVANFMAGYGRNSLPQVVVSIGPITTGTLLAHGVEEVITSVVHDISGVVGALASHFSRDIHN